MLSDADFLLVGKAYVMANGAHSEQKRKWERDAPYIVHPVRVAHVIGNRTDDFPNAVNIAAALLHDTLEDTEVTEDDIRRLCGEDVLTLVKELTNPSADMPLEAPRIEKKKVDFEKMQGISRAAKIIKMYDRLDNISYGNPPENFMRKYLPESVELAVICGDADPELKDELLNKIHQLTGAAV